MSPIEETGSTPLPNLDADRAGLSEAGQTTVFVNNTTGEGNTFLAVWNDGNDGSAGIFIDGGQQGTVTFATPQEGTSCWMRAIDRFGHQIESGDNFVIAPDMPTVLYDYDSGGTFHQNFFNRRT